MAVVVHIVACVRGWVCGIPRVVAWVCVRVVACPRVCVVARARVFACGCVWGGPRTQVRGPPLGGVLWRFPTLPHPLGCSTIGAAGLSFQVRNVAGRFPGAVTTTRLCRPPCWPAVWRGVLARRVVGWVGGGLVVVRIVVAAPPCPPCCRVLARVCGPGGGGGCLVARPPSLLAPVRCSGLPVLLLVAVFAVWGVGAGVGGVGVVSAH